MEGLNFSILEKVKETNEVCDKHNINKVSLGNMEPFCRECVQEQRAIEHDQMIAEFTAKRFKEITYAWLKNKSIISDDSLKNATFDKYKTDDEETTVNKQQARMIAKDYLDNKVFNTILTGIPGTGKSHLSMSILEAVNENSNPYRKCLFVSVDEMLRMVKDSFNYKESKYTEQYMVDMLGAADLLVLDDLGAETGAMGTIKEATDFTQKLLYAVINQRQNKSTIINTNLSSKDLSRMYDPKLLSRMYKGSKGHIIKFSTTKDKRMEVEF